MKVRLTAAVLIGVATSVATACSDRGPAGVVTAEFTLSSAQGQPGAQIEIRGLPAGVSGSTHWVEVGGEHTALFTPEGDVSYFTVPLFLPANAVWPVVPATPVEVVLRNANGVLMSADRRFTVTPLQRADGTLAGVVEDLHTVAASLKAIADVIPPGVGEAARFAFVISRTLDRLQHSPGVSAALAVAELEATPALLPLADALFAAGGTHLPIRDMAYRFNGIAGSVTAPASLMAASPAAREHSTPAAPIELLSDETLAMLMQLAVYLKQNTDFAASTSKQLSNMLGLLGVLRVDLDFANKAPIAKAVGLIASRAAAQAVLLNKYLVASLPSQLDSLTITLASHTLTPSQRTASRVDVHASNKPDPVTLGDLLSAFQTAAGIVGAADYLESTTQFILGQVNDLMQSYASTHPDVTYDSNIIDLWSVPQLSFRAHVITRRLVELRSQAPDVVEPLANEVNWIARATGSAQTSIRVEPSIGNATIPVLAEWLADVVSTNSGSASDLVLGAFGEVVKSSAPVDVRVEAETCRIGDVQLELDFGGGEIDPTIVGPVLEDGFDYFITVSGTYSIWRGMWENGVCKGVPHNGPGGLTGFDAEYRFAVPVGSSLCDRDEEMPNHSSKFRMSLDGGASFAHREPIIGFYNPDHVYEYRVTGEGQPIHFRLAEDSARGDDYGILSISVACPVEPDAAGAAGSR